jgi:hypothetical protein
MGSLSEFSFAEEFGKKMENLLGGACSNRQLCCIHSDLMLFIVVFKTD